jgi:predicted ester cyclase
MENYKRERRHAHCSTKRKERVMKNGNTEIVKQYMENILNTGNAEDLSTFISPHYTEVLNKKRYRLGIKGMRKKIAGIREIYPDLKLSVDTQITEGDWVVTSYIMNGTQLGSWMGIKPTGKTVEVRGVNIDRVVDGKITEHGSSTELLDPLIEINQYSKHWIKNNLWNKFAPKNEDVKTASETKAA